MKRAFRQWVLQMLRWLAKRRLARIQPNIVGITGSAGKTSTKEMVAAVLSRRFKIKKNLKSLNTEFGTLLTILEKPSGYSSPAKWLAVLAKSLWESFRPVETYEHLVLEMGVDKPGDMDDILKVFTPNTMVFLNVKEVHLGEGHFANRQAIFEEKARACYAVAAGDWAVLNMDDNFVSQLKDKLMCNVVTVGTTEDCDLYAKDIRATEKGLAFTLAYENKEHAVKMPGVLGDCHVTNVLAAIAVGFIHGMPWSVIEASLQEYMPPPGRMNKIEGKNGALIIDSSYNASPDTMEAALKVLKLFRGRRIAALGTMNELGELTESAHLKLGKSVPEYADMLIAVGPQAKTIAEGAHVAGLSASMIHVFPNSVQAGAFLENLLEKNDIVLAKGSQNNVRMERLVKACMKEPEQARHLLVRQEPYWLTQL